MPAAIGVFRLVTAGADDHVELLVDQHVDHLRRSGGIVGQVAVGHQVDVGVDVREHAPDDIALALLPLRPDDRAGLGGDFAGPVGAVVIVDVNRRIGQRRTESGDGRRDRGFLIVAGQDHGDGCHGTRCRLRVRTCKSSKLGRCQGDTPSGFGRDRESVAGLDAMLAIRIEARRAVEDEAEHQFAVVRGRAEIASDCADLGETARRLGYRRFLRFAAVAGGPGRVSRHVMKEALASEPACRIGSVRQAQLMVSKRRVDRGCADLDHLQPRRAFENAVANLRRLEDEVALAHHERLALVLVDDSTQPRRTWIIWKAIRW